MVITNVFLISFHIHGQFLLMISQLRSLKWRKIENE